MWTSTETDLWLIWIVTNGVQKLKARPWALLFLLQDLSFELLRSLFTHFLAENVSHLNKHYQGSSHSTGRPGLGFTQGLAAVSHLLFQLIVQLYLYVCYHSSRFWTLFFLHFFPHSQGMIFAGRGCTTEAAAKEICHSLASHWQSKYASKSLTCLFICENVCGWALREINQKKTNVNTSADKPQTKGFTLNWRSFFACSRMLAAPLLQRKGSGELQAHLWAHPPLPRLGGMQLPRCLLVQLPALLPELTAKSSPWGIPGTPAACGEPAEAKLFPLCWITTPFSALH